MRRPAARIGWLCALMLASWLPPSYAQAPVPDDDGDCTGAPCPLIAIDTLLYVENRGVTRFFVDLNGHRFKLATDPAEVRQSANAFLVPRQGAITVHIGAYLAPDDDDPYDDTCAAGDPASGNNCITITPQGPEGAGADIIVADLLLPGQRVAYRIGGLTAIPPDFALVGSAPNPFSVTTTITYHIQESRTTGLPITLALYDVAGRRVRTLVDERRYPGRFETVWDGTGDDGAPVASGLYFCHMTAEGVRETVSVVLIR